MTRRVIAGRSVRWDAARAAQHYDAGHWRHETLADTLRKAARDTPDRVLLIDGAEAVTAALLLARARRLAGAMQQFASPGDAVSIMLPNWHEAATAYLAACIAGLVAHPVPPALRHHELAQMLPDLGSRALFVPGVFRGFDYAAMAREVAAGLDPAPRVIVVRDEGGASLDAMLATGRPFTAPEIDPDGVQMAMYTSGTTGMPKGVLHSHNSLGALVRQLGEHWLVDPGDAFLVASPVSHIGGSIYAFEMPLMLGSRAVLMDSWDPVVALELMRVHRCTHMAGATPFLEGLLAAAREQDEHLPQLKLFICGGASVPPALIREAAAQFPGAVVTRVYGSTEVPVITVGSIGRGDLDHAATTDGTPGVAEVRLTPVAGCDPDEGEICARGPQMLVGYVHPEDEADLFDPEGFYRTGDLGRWVDGRYLVVSGRSKDVIIRKGENIAPKEIEDLLIEHPDVADVAVVGMPDAQTGERAWAVVVPRQGAQPTLEELNRFLAEHRLAKFKRPERLVIRETLPRNAAGKVLKTEIRATLAKS